MNKNIYFFFLLGFLLWIAQSQLQLELQKTEATLYTNNKILLKFKIKGGSQPYILNFNGIPNDWKQLSNDLVISNVNQSSSQQWVFDIYLVDAFQRSLSQTVKLVLDKYQIMLYPVTYALQSTKPVTKNDLQKLTTNSFLNDLINRYPGKKQSGFNIDYSNSIITPQLIQNARATYNASRDSRPITQLQMRSNAASIRQNNAVKAVANINSIIEGLKRNLREAQNSIPEEQRRFKQMKDAAFECSQQIFKIEDTQAKIKNAITDRNTKVGQYKTFNQQSNKKIEELKNNSTALNVIKLQIQKLANPEGQLLAQADKKIAGCQSKIKQRQNKIISLNIESTNNNLQIKIAQDGSNSANTRLQNIQSSLNIVQQRIAELRRQLNEAETQQQNLLADKKFYQASPIDAKNRIDQLERKNKQIELKIKQLQQSNRQQQVQCKKIKDDAAVLKIKISEREQKYSEILAKVQQIKKNVKQNQQSIKQQELNIKNLNSQIFALKNQFTKTEERLFQQKFLCSVAEEKKNRQQIKISQINNYITQNTKSLSEASINLQKARAEQQLAHQAVEQIMRRTTNVTLYPIVPNFGSTLLGGTPLGNNPSGAALGPPFRVDSVEKGAIVVSNLSNFLSTVYGMNIDPTSIIQQVFARKKQQGKTPNSSDLINSITLYPMDEESRKKIMSNGFSGLSNFNCDTTGPVISASGLLQKVSLGSLVVQDNLNKKYVLSISSCTKITSTAPTNFFTIGNKISFTGSQVRNILEASIFDAYSIVSSPK